MSNTANLPAHARDFKIGSRVIELGSDNSVLYITGFEQDGNDEYRAVCLKLGSDKIVKVPVSFLKPSNQRTLH